MLLYANLPIVISSAFSGNAFLQQDGVTFCFVCMVTYCVGWGWVGDGETFYWMQKTPFQEFAATEELFNGYKQSINSLSF